MEVAEEVMEVQEEAVPWKCKRKFWLSSLMPQAQLKKGECL